GRCGVDRAEGFPAGDVADARGDSVRRVDQPGALGHLVGFFDEDRALLAEAVDHVAVVDDLLADVDGSAADRQRLLDDVDGAHDARAEPPQARDQERFDFRQVASGYQGTVSATRRSFSSAPRAPDREPAWRARSG